ncbi:hypothetical protein ABPG72_000320 [Tetrahymena utriculariae]
MISIIIPFYVASGVCFNVIFPNYIVQLYKIMSILDIIINLNTGYFEQGHQVNNKLKILNNYLKSSFFIDLICLIPIFMHFDFVSCNTDSSQISFDKIPLLLCLLKITQFSKTFNKIQERFLLTPKSTNFISLCKLLGTMIFVCHLFACSWVFLGKMQINYNLNNQNWLKKSNLQDDTIQNIYLHALYYSITAMSTVEYGDITPISQIEILWSLFSILMSSKMFALQNIRQENIQSTIGKRMMQMIQSNKKIQLTNSQVNSQESNSQWILIEQYLKIHQYLSTTSAQMLSLKLQTQFNNQHEHLKRKLLKEEKYNNKYFLQKKLFYKLSKGKSFGIVGFFTGFPESYTVRQDFLEVLKEFSNDYEKFCFIKDNITLYDNLDLIKKNCLSCLSTSHSLQFCPETHNIPKKENIIASFNHKNLKQRYEFERKSYSYKIKGITLQKYPVSCFQNDNKDFLEDFYIKSYLPFSIINEISYQNLEDTKLTNQNEMKSFSQLNLTSNNLTKEIEEQNQNSKIEKDDSKTPLKKYDQAEKSEMSLHQFKNTLNKIDSFFVIGSQQKIQDQNYKKIMVMPQIKGSFQLKSHKALLNNLKYNQSIEEQFEVFRNFEYYFPLNNQNFILQILNLAKSDKKWFIQKYNKIYQDIYKQNSKGVSQFRRKTIFNLNLPHKLSPQIVNLSSQLAQKSGQIVEGYPQRKQLKQMQSLDKQSVHTFQKHFQQATSITTYQQYSKQNQVFHQFTISDFLQKPQFLPSQINQTQTADQNIQKAFICQIKQIDHSNIITNSSRINEFDDYEIKIEYEENISQAQQLNVVFPQRQLEY